MHQLSWRVCGILRTVLSHFPIWLSYREVSAWCWHLKVGKLWKSQSICARKEEKNEEEKNTLTAHKAPPGLKYLLSVIGITTHRHPALSLLFFMCEQLWLSLINTRLTGIAWGHSLILAICNIKCNMPSENSPLLRQDQWINGPMD